MSSKKVFFGMIGLLVVMCGLVIGAVVMGDMLLKKQANKLMELKIDTDVVESQQTALIQAKKDVEKYAELEAIAKEVVPQDKDQARAVREIISLAEQAGIKISNISFPASTLGQKPAAAVAPSDSGTPPAAAATTPAQTQTKAVTGIDGLYQLEITVTSDASSPATYTKLIDFLERLEHNRRTAQVGQISITPDPVNRNRLNFTLTLTVYIKP